MCTGQEAASDKVHNSITLDLWFSPCTPDFSITKTGRHDIAAILLKVALSNQSVNIASIMKEVIEDR